MQHSALFRFRQLDAGLHRECKVHWQAGDRPLPAPAVSVAGESAL